MVPLVLSPSETIDPLLQQFVVCFEFINFLLQLTDLVRAWDRREGRSVGGSDCEGDVSGAEVDAVSEGGCNEGGC